MTKAIASKLETLVESNSDFVNWENAESQWKEKIEQAIAVNDYPSYLIYPHTPEALSEIMKCAHDYHWAVIPCGSGSKLNWGGLLKNIQLVISTQRLNRIIEHAVGDLTVTVEAGVKLADLQHTLNQTGQFLPLDPAYPESATIGGIVATADSGSWRQRYGGVRDMLLGLSFVRADGQIAKAGGRVVKNVAGYDLMKLFTGSYGTLGIISQVTFRVYPLPEASKTVVLTGDKSAIATATQTLLTSALTPTAADLLSASLVSRLVIGQGMGLMVRFQSIAESVKEQSAQIKAIAQRLGLQAGLYRDGDETDLWQRLQQIMRSPASVSAISCKIGVIPTAAATILNQLDELSSKQGLGMINASSGLGRLHLDSEDALSQIRKLRSLCQEHRGFLSVLEAPAAFKQQLESWGYTGNALEIMGKIKKQFDPENLFSPGRFIGGI
ncbi:MAG: FAD-binding oxidoreductase [Xenococcaceae cyanobacterium]